MKRILFGVCESGGPCNPGKVAELQGSPIGAPFHTAISLKDISHQSTRRRRRSRYRGPERKALVGTIFIDAYGERMRKDDRAGAFPYRSDRAKTRVKNGIRFQSR